MRIDFVQGAQPYRKELGPEAPRNYYPKNVTSTTAEIPDTLTALVECLNNNIDKAMLVGRLDRPLVNESRAGRIPIDSMTQILILDIDGVPMDSIEAVIAQIGLGNTAYAYKPSASTGVVDESGQPIKSGIRGHIAFVLEREVPVGRLKNFVKQLNKDHLSDYLRLSPTGHGLMWLLDPKVCEASTALFMSPPTVHEPWRDTLETRFWTAVTENKSRLTLDAGALTAERFQNIDKDTSTLINAKRVEIGLPRKRNLTEVIKNPDKKKITYLYDARGYSYYNVGDGDSEAYYHPVENPEVMYNFKEEAPFIFEAMDQSAYDDAVARFMAVPQFNEEGNDIRYIVFRDNVTDKHYAGVWNVTEESVEVHTISKMNIEDFLKDNNTPVPSPIPQADLTFRPDVDWAVRLNERNRVTQVNRYKHTKWDRYVHSDVVPASTMEECHIHFGSTVPAIYALMHHVLGEDLPTNAHFINWLAANVQTRKKAQTAWIITGDPGTGKDTLVDLVIEPLFGGFNAVYKTTLHDLTDRFNSWAGERRLVVVSEARDADLKKSDRLMLTNNMKEWITNPVVSMRPMYQETMQVQNFTSFILMSNFYDVIKIPRNDRRYNVSPRQRTPLHKREYPLAGLFDFRTDTNAAFEGMKEAIEAELPKFVHMLNTFNVNRHAVVRPLENETKKLMESTTENNVEAFFSNLDKGNLDFFIDLIGADLLDMKSASDRAGSFTTVEGYKIMLAEILPRLNEPINMKIEQIMLLWAITNNKDWSSLSPLNMRRMLRQEGMIENRDHPGTGSATRRVNGITVTWTLSHHSPDIVHQYIREFGTGTTQSLPH